MPPPPEGRFMARAVELAERGLYTTTPNPRVGCVLVKHGRVIGEGWHVAAGGPHAEIDALGSATESTRGATAYVTLEPCCHQGRTPPCTEALIAAGVKRVVVAMHDPNPRMAGRGLERLASAGVAVSAGLLRGQSEALNPGFILRMVEQRPFVRCKLAMSIDGRTAMADGESRWISGPEARREVQRWRARSCAIVTGVGTVISDDPALTVRAAELGLPPEETPAGVRQPLRVVVDTRLRTPPGAKIFSQPGRTLVATASAPGAACERLEQAGAALVRLPASGGRVELAPLMRYLAGQQVNEVLLEAGATLSGAMLTSGLVDELVLYMAPVLMGHRARGLLDLPWLERMPQRIRLHITEVRTVGADLRIVARPERGARVDDER